MSCRHPDFVASVDVNRVESEEGLDFTTDLKITCAACGVPMQFLGLPIGVNMRGAAMSADGLRATLAMVPQGQAPHPLAVAGFELWTPPPKGGEQ